MRPPQIASTEKLDEVPDVPAVFLVHMKEGAPYLARTGVLRRRLSRLFAERDHPSHWLNLRGLATHVEYWRTGSRLESGIVYYELARAHFPDDYRKRIKLRLPAYVKLTLANPFPRTMITSHLAGGRALYYGPFRTRLRAEEFQSQFLDLFQIRRCQEDLDPSPTHPGCIYGEMNLCCRPCQQVVSPEEYHTEVDRVVQFFSTDGRSLLESTAALRDQLSEEMNFEEAARLHKRYQRVEQVLALRDELVREAGHLSGVAVMPSAEPDAVELWVLLGGCWQEPCRFPLTGVISMDHRLREALSVIQPRKGPREEHLALLARWYYSSWRDGEWLPFDSLEHAPYRRLVNAVARVAKSREAR